jgi:uncharacterized protein (TIGR02001 family)
MNPLRTFSITALLALGTALPAAAQVSFSFGASVVSNYISRGLTQTSNGAAFQPWAEIGFNGAYAGIWASNVNNGTDTAEIDLLAGYRFDLGGLSMDIGYAHYFYNVTPSSGEIYLLGSFDAGTAEVFGGLYFATGGALNLSDAHLGVTAPVYDALSATVKIGNNNAGTTYADLSFGYDVTANLSISAGANYSSTEGTRFLAGVSTSF